MLRNVSWLPCADATPLGGYAVEAGLVDANWQEVRQVFPKDRVITFPQDLEPKEALFKAGFSEAESHVWRFIKKRSLAEIIMVLRYAPVVRDFDETADRPFLSKLENLHGDSDGIRLTEGESLVVGRKDELDSITTDIALASAGRGLDYRGPNCACSFCGSEAGV